MKRNFTGLTKFAYLIKKADPPHRGLNDDNPAKRYIYQRYGFIPQSPLSYLSGANSRGLYIRALAAADKFSKKELGLPRKTKNIPLDNEALREHKARLFDIFRSSGTFPSPAYMWDRQGPVSERGLVIAGGYPFSEESIKHELGHAKDYEYDYGFDKPVMEQELAAWNNTDIPEGDVLRESALDTYRAQQDAQAATKYRRLFTGPFDRVKLMRAAINRGKDARDRLFAESRARYRHPETYIHKYIGKVPILYDYKSIHDAAHRGLLDYAINVK